MIEAEALLFPYIPLALAAEIPSTNSTSPTGLKSFSISALYIALASIKTVEVILCPLISSKSSCNKYLP